ncbi:MAG: flagellar hook-basal body protein, partial [Holosporales bacterium]
ANMNSTAFNKRTLLTTTLAYQDFSRVGTLTSSAGTVKPAGIQIGMGVKMAGVARLLNQGPAIQSDDPFHLMIEGPGYFQITLPSGEIGYTRDGSFTVNAEGQMVTQQGYLLEPNITIPANVTSVTINPNGDVSVKIDGQTQPQVVGTITLANFVNPGGLTAIDNNTFLETVASGGPNIAAPGQPGFGTLLQNALEGSNVNAVTEMTGLIRIQQAYEMDAKVQQTASRMGEASVNIV